MKKSMRARRIRMAIAALPLALGIWIGGAGCVIVDEDNCLEGEIVCSGDFIEECIDDRWVLVDDCFDLCGGTCIYDDVFGPSCLCSI
jgi:hypothetical protein